MWQLYCTVFLIALKPVCLPGLFIVNYTVLCCPCLKVHFFLSGEYPTCQGCGRRRHRPAVAWTRGRPARRLRVGAGGSLTPRPFTGAPRAEKVYRLLYPPFTFFILSSFIPYCSLHLLILSCSPPVKSYFVPLLLGTFRRYCSWLCYENNPWSKQPSRRVM